MSLGVMLIGAVTLCYIGWRLWKMMKGQSGGGCGGEVSCSGCGNACSNKEKK